MIRSKKALLNISFTLILQLVTIISSFILPRLIINAFGSNVNGLIVSIGQFISYISLLEAGVGGVVRAALYKPLAENDQNSISGIIKATNRFFNIIAWCSVGFCLLLAIILPIFQKSFSFQYVFFLVLIIGIGTFTQYFFGMSYQILIQADQKKFVPSILQITIIILNTIFSVILIKLGMNIQVVKLLNALVFCVKPIILNRYVKKKYSIDPHVERNDLAIKQRWDGLGHHIAFFLRKNSDIVILTVFTNNITVSIYSVYFLVVSGIEVLATTLSSGIEATFGNMIAKNEIDILNKNFRIYEFMSYSIVTILYASTCMLILPFISLYTKGITDANYHQPLLAYCLVIASAIYCIRLPYHYVTLAAGHYKQTRNGAFAEAIINIVLSIVLVNIFGMAGVVIATICAVLFRTIQYAIYLSKNILKRKINEFIKRCIIYSSATVLSILLARLIPVIPINNYLDWCIYALTITGAVIIITMTINLVFYRNDCKDFIKILRKVLKRTHKS